MSKLRTLHHKLRIVYMDKDIRTKGSIMLIVCALICLSFVDRVYLNLENQTNPTFQFIEKYSVRALPLTDSTSFDNYKVSTTLTNEQSKLLKLDKVMPDKDVTFRINYRLNLSPNFKSLVVCYYPNEQELFTVLINYTNSFDIVDFKTIAYDEIAEGFIKTKSLISKDKIEVTQRDDSSGRPEIKTTKFEIKKDGQIKTCP
jgi:hypothetical protein